MNFFLKILIFLKLLIIPYFIFANNVEDIFVDINSSYNYITELQYLYDAWIISPDINNRFNANSLLNRWDFTSMIMSLKCEECLQPNTSASNVLNFYNFDSFYDISSKDKNYYCIWIANYKNVVRWYGTWYRCNSWELFFDDKNPFCPDDNITLEEAIAVIVRNSWVDINSILSLDEGVYEKYDDVDESSDFYKYIVAGLSDTFAYNGFNSFWDPLEIRLLEHTQSRNLWVKQNITREKFLQMSYFFSKFTWSCNFVDTKESWFWLKIDICEAESELCTITDLNQEVNKYSLQPNIKLSCPSWIKNHIWKIVDLDSMESLVHNTKNLENYDFPEWNWFVRHIAEDNCWNIAESSFSFSNIVDLVEDSDSNNKSVSIDWPIDWYAPLKVDFKSLTEWFSNNATYEWNFWDGTTSNQKNPTHIFRDKWTYYVELIVRENWVEKKANIIIEVESFIDDFDYLYWLDNNNLKSELIKIIDKTKDDNLKVILEDLIDKLEDQDYDPTSDLDNLRNLIDYDEEDGYSIDTTLDTDWDWVPDYRDKCIWIAWPEENDGCPILDNKCNISQNEMMSCPRWYICNSETQMCEPKNISTHHLAWTCLFPSSLSWIFWNIKCITCPCEYTLSFIADIRRCDIVFPTITWSWGVIENRWDFFQIPSE